MRKLLVVTAALTCVLVGGGCGKSETKPATASGVDRRWADHVGDIPFVEGPGAGAATVAATGRPAMYFFTSPT
jgi:hypothetical protein